MDLDSEKNLTHVIITEKWFQKLISEVYPAIKQLWKPFSFRSPNSLPYTNSWIRAQVYMVIKKSYQLVMSSVSTTVRLIYPLEGTRVKSEPGESAELYAPV